MDVQICPITYVPNDGGCILLAGRLLREFAPDFGAAIDVLRLEPAFDEENWNEGSGVEVDEFRKRLPEKAEFDFSRSERKLTIRYSSKVCFGRDLIGRARLPEGPNEPENESSFVLEEFYRELMGILSCFEDLIQPTDDFDTARFLSWVKDRFDELPVDNGAVQGLAKRRETLPEKEQARLNEIDFASMDRDEFWAIIKQVDVPSLEWGNEEYAVAPIIADLSQRSVAQIKSFYNHLTNVLYDLDTKRHFKSYPEGYTDDSFLYARCYVVGLGRKHYEAVLADPALMPHDEGRFEWLLSAAPEAWSYVTGENSNDFDINCTERCFGSGCNREGWEMEPNRLQYLWIEDTRDSIEAMLSADRRESATATNFWRGGLVSLLKELQFEFPYEIVSLSLLPSFEHGEVRPYLLNEYKRGLRADFNVGFDAVRFVALSEPERERFFLDVAIRALELLCARDAIPADKLFEARCRVLESMSDRE